MALTPDAVLHSPPSLVGLDLTADAGLAEGLAALESHKKKDSAKGQRPSKSPTHTPELRAKSPVVVRFKAVGNAPIMKQNFFRVTVSNRFQAVIQFLRKELGWKAGEPLVSVPPGLRAFYTVLILCQFTYINLAFSPAPDDTIANLYRVSLFIHL